MSDDRSDVAPAGSRPDARADPPADDPAPDVEAAFARTETIPLDVRRTLRVLRRGAGDPTWVDGAGGSVWKAWRTPDGPVTVHLADDRTPPERRRRPDLRVRAWGPGADWIVERMPTVLGAADDDTGFVPRHEDVARARREHADWRVPATGLVIEALVPSIIEQKVTGKEAFAAYRHLVRRYGTPAPGPGPALRLVVAPAAAQWARIPSWEWTRAGVDAHRATTVMRAVRVAGRLEECVRMDPVDASRRLRAVPGIGRWTAAEVAHVALGDADAVSFGDYHVAANIGWALTGTPVDDDALADLLEPYRPHRYRVQRLLELGGAVRPRRGPRFRLPTHIPGAW